MRARLVILLVVLSAINGNAQEFKFGLTTGTHLFHRMTFEEKYYSPANSFYTYEEEVAGKGVIRKSGFVNSFAFGPAVSLAYKRFTVNLEPQYFYQRSVMKFAKPDSTERLLGKKAFRVPFYGTFKFFKKENSIFFIAGLMFHKESVRDIQNPGFDVYLNGEDYNANVLNLGDNHFYSVLYNEKSYWSYMLGLGKNTKSGINVAARFHRRINTTNRGISGSITNVELAITYLFISTKDFTKKHFLYFD